MSNWFRVDKAHWAFHIAAFLGLALANACSSTTSTSTSTGGATSGSTGTVASGGISAGGGQASSGGSQSASGGSQNFSGGSQNASGGSQAVGGTPVPNGGSSFGVSGAASAMSGARNVAGVPSTSSSGSSSVNFGGAPNLTAGAPGMGGALGNMGGTQSSAGARSAGGTSGSAGSPTALRSASADPTYATSGAWHGYIWPAIESGAAVTPGSVTTIMPNAATGFRAGGPPYCVTGHVPATTNSTSVAMIGMNTNQERSGGAVAAQWTATGTGILVNVSNPGGSPLRLQIQTNETGAVATLWCAMLTAFDQNVIIPWNQLNTRCWNNSGTSYDQSVGISTIMVLVPGTAQAGGYDFDFCVNDLAPV